VPPAATPGSARVSFGRGARPLPSLRPALLAGLLLLAFAVAPVAAAELPAVVRPELLGADGAPATDGAAGTVFFLALPSGGVAAVGAAHSFDLGKLADAPAVELRLGRTGKRVARSTRLLAPPRRSRTSRLAAR
jgi:hypothetical protein